MTVDSFESELTMPLCIVEHMKFFSSEDVGEKCRYPLTGFSMFRQIKWKTEKEKMRGQEATVNKSSSREANSDGHQFHYYFGSSLICNWRVRNFRSATIYCLAISGKEEIQFRRSLQQQAFSITRDLLR